jgi:hypothetical protein
MRYLKNLTVVVAMVLLPLIQISLTAVWGEFGRLAMPVFWGILLTFFYFDESWRWPLIIIAGVILDLHDGLFGVELISLAWLGAVFAFMLSRWLIHKNFVAWFLAGLLGLPIYFLSRSLIQWLFNYSVNQLWFWHFDWAEFLCFWFVNLLVVTVLYYIFVLFKKRFRHD